MNVIMKSFVLCGAAGALFTLPASLAHAQYGAPDVRIVQPYGPVVAYGEIAPYDALSIARSTGLRPAGRPVRRGPNYELLAIDTDGVPVRVTIDARRGRVLDVRAAGPAVAPERRVMREGRRWIEEEPLYSERVYEGPRYERRYEEPFMDGPPLRATPDSRDPQVVYGAPDVTRPKPKSPKVANKPAPKKAAAKTDVKKTDVKKEDVKKDVAPAQAAQPAAAQTPAPAADEVKTDPALAGTTPAAGAPQGEASKAETPKVDASKSEASK